MASHFRLGKKQIFTAGVLSGTSTITSPVIHILNLDNIYLQLNVSGTATGAFSLQVSGDHLEDQEGNVLVAGSWIEVVSLPIAGSAVNLGEDLNQLGAPYFRVQYTNVSGSGTVNGFISGKGLI